MSVFSGNISIGAELESPAYRLFSQGAAVPFGVKRLSFRLDRLSNLFLAIPYERFAQVRVLPLPGLQVKEIRR
jgi:hypothetical protein